MTHLAAGCELHLLLLKIQRGLWEVAPGADVIVMQMAYDQVVDIFGLDADHAEAFGRLAKKHAAALLSFRLIKAGIKNIGLVLANDRPNEIVHWHRRIIMRVLEDQMIVSHRIAPGIFYCVDFVGLERCFGHGLVLTLRLWQQGIADRMNLLK